MIRDLEVFREHEPRLLRDSTCREAAVMIPLIKRQDGYDILFEVRSSTVGDQPGDICFPGGAIEEGEDALTAVVRECCEELLIGPSDIEVIGGSDFFHNFGVVIYPFVGTLTDYDGTFSTDEVSEVFTVPLDFFLETEPEFHCNEWKVPKGQDFPYELINGGEDYKWRKMIQEHPFYFYGDRVIWGITARILYGAVKIIKGLS